MDIWRDMTYLGNRLGMDLLGTLPDTGRLHNTLGMVLGDTLGDTYLQCSITDKVFVDIPLGIVHLDNKLGMVLLGSQGDTYPEGSTQGKVLLDMLLDIYFLGSSLDMDSPDSPVDSPHLGSKLDI